MSELLKEFKQYLRENEESYKSGARDSIEYPLGYEEVKLLLNEIKRLNKERSKTYENGLNYFLELKEKDKEIERLNNIIKELEKYFEQEGFWHSLDKIKELKGSDK